MQEIPTSKIDLQVFNLINGFAKKSRVLDFFAVFCAEYLGYLFAGILLVLAFWFGRWQLFVEPLAAGFLARCSNEIVYLFYQRKRPMEVLPITTLIKKPNHPAFPSGHTSFFFAASFCLLLFSTQLAILFLAASALVGFFRVFCGVHWPSDILGGIGAGFISFLMLMCLITIIL